LEAGAEITLEANPDDISLMKLDELKAIGINRLSIGVQSFFEEDLTWMNRAHNAKQANDCISLSKQAGFDNISIDLIYGTPTLSDERWQENVQKAIDMNISHLSCYALTVEPKTALEKMIAQNKVVNVDMDRQAHHFEMLMQQLGDAGYEHYEISNFSKPGKRSRHNSNYWKGKPYLGIGPSAHSFNGDSRQWNVSNNALYIQSLLKGIIPYEIETLTIDQQLNEYIMTSLRTLEGLSLEKIRKDFGEQNAAQLLRSANTYIALNLLKNQHGFLQTTNEGKLRADGIAADLFTV
jgi:oxygen-independent coproporphyrinogen-3 oxidase